MTITVNPTLLPSAADAVEEAAVNERAQENHSCARCAKPATAAQVIGTDAGSRWLDFCGGCQAEYDDFNLMLEARADTNEYGIGPSGATEPTIEAGVHEPGLANARRMVAASHPGFLVFRRTNGGPWALDTERS
ncbi:hypothetical protein ACFWIW_10760 [Amycolatopsis sp. NPDC058340]|uniref:hypothetical protein n=1 Tax=Amycolatopsis sp. NPDC058340 TaxID=3346453 RepID=UPI00364A0D22